MNPNMTKKLVMVVFLIMMLMIPLTMITNVVKERSSYREEARHSIAESWTGEQKVLGPLLVVPYKEYYKKKVWNAKKEDYQFETHHWDKKIYLAPEQLGLRGDIATDERSRGLYTIPVYTSDLTVSGHFTTQKLLQLRKQSQHRIEWQPAYLSVVVNDVRGVVEQPQLQWQGKPVEFLSGAQLDSLNRGMHAELGTLGTKEEKIPFSFRLLLRGMEKLQFSPLGKSTSVEMSADWPHPSFIGRYLPGERGIDAQGFVAKWNISSFSSGMPQLLAECQQGHCGALMEDTFGVYLFNSVDIYQQSERAVKYAMLFIGLIFVAFFLFEVLKGLRLHPMQYLLVGLGLSVFYLLLISLSEHLAFSQAYLLAALASTGVIGFYVSGVLHSVRHGITITAGLLLLYAMLFGILRSEDNALLMGALLLFSVLSLVMVVTRRVDWYAIGEGMAARSVLKGGEKNSKELLEV